MADYSQLLSANFGIQVEQEETIRKIEQAQYEIRNLTQQLSTTIKSNQEKEEVGKTLTMQLDAFSLEHKVAEIEIKDNLIEKEIKFMDRKIEFHAEEVETQYRTIEKRRKYYKAIYAELSWNKERAIHQRENRLLKIQLHQVVRSIELCADARRMYRKMIEDPVEKNIPLAIAGMAVECSNFRKKIEHLKKEFIEKVKLHQVKRDQVAQVLIEASTRNIEKPNIRQSARDMGRSEIALPNVVIDLPQRKPEPLDTLSIFKNRLSSMISSGTAALQNYWQTSEVSKAPKVQDTAMVKAPFQCSSRSTIAHTEMRPCPTAEVVKIPKVQGTAMDKASNHFSSRSTIPDTEMCPSVPDVSVSLLVKSHVEHGMSPPLNQPELAQEVQMKKIVTFTSPRGSSQTPLPGFRKPEQTEGNAARSQLKPTILPATASVQMAPSSGNAGAGPSMPGGGNVSVIPKVKRSRPKTQSNPVPRKKKQAVPPHMLPQQQEIIDLTLDDDYLSSDRESLSQPILPSAAKTKQVVRRANKSTKKVGFESADLIKVQKEHMVTRPDQIQQAGPSARGPNRFVPNQRPVAVASSHAAVELKQPPPRPIPARPAAPKVAQPSNRSNPPKSIPNTTSIQQTRHVKTRPGAVIQHLNRNPEPNCSSKQVKPSSLTVQAVQKSSPEVTEMNTSKGHSPQQSNQPLQVPLQIQGTPISLTSFDSIPSESIPQEVTSPPMTFEDLQARLGGVSTDLEQFPDVNDLFNDESNFFHIGGNQQANSTGGFDMFFSNSDPAPAGNKSPNSDFFGLFR